MHTLVLSSMTKS